jgi:gamma-glutamylcyclotransferase (GGCT)/AIG2-like uncharacterized protein YtfP
VFHLLKKNKPAGLYFAYGANMSKRSMSHRCPNAKPVKAFYLLDWRLMFSHHATIVPAAGTAVPGCLWEITEECERSLDHFEGYPNYYNKIWLTQHGLSFMVYEMNPPLNPKYTPAPQYVQLLEEGYSNWDLDLQYLDDALYYELG